MSSGVFGYFELIKTNLFVEISNRVISEHPPELPLQTGFVRYLSNDFNFLVWPVLTLPTMCSNRVLGNSLQKPNFIIMSHSLSYMNPCSDGVLQIFKMSSIIACRMINGIN